MHLRRKSPSIPSKQGPGERDSLRRKARHETIYMAVVEEIKLLRLDAQLPRYRVIVAAGHSHLGYDADEEENKDDSGRPRPRGTAVAV
ncbi:hypothetical protein PG994_001413 [Apiospora phragmitis]|uniref:Uncharacterized protein n=1 Tax=Apiospora phragmitis TaxID=2905665 RepID=A0ABR1WTG3_9PEZI